MEIFLNSTDSKELDVASQLTELSGVDISDIPKNLDSLPELLENLHRKTKLIQIPLPGNNANEWKNSAKTLLSKGVDSTRIVFRLPCTREGIEVCHVLRAGGLFISMGEPKDINHALMGLKAGALMLNLPAAKVFAPVPEGGSNRNIFIEIMHLIQNYNFSSRVVINGITSSQEVEAAALSGANACAIPYDILMQMVS